MKSNKVMNFVIVLLVITAVCQTGKLWLGDVASHSFFYTTFAKGIVQPQKVYAESGAISPARIVMGYGNKKFSISYISTDDNSIINYADSIIKGSLNNGIYLKKNNFEWDDILLSKCVIYDYGKLVSSLDYFSIKKLPEMDFEFDYIFIYPSRATGEDTRVSFINSYDETEVLYTFKKNTDSEELYNIIEQNQIKENDIMYISTKQSGFNIFEKNIFLPQWTGETYSYSSITKNNPFMVDGNISINLLENSVDNFFKNFISQWYDNINGVSTFSDDTTVVKYYPSGVLEYFNYNIVEESKSNFFTSYTACKNFMQNDVTLKTNYYLKDFIKDSDGNYIFYFDYMVEKFPLILSDNIKDETELKSSIEITVKNNLVVKYKRYAFNFYIQSSKDSVANCDFLTALDSVISNLNEEDKKQKVDDIRLAYCIDKANTIKLKWFIKIDDTYYTVKSTKVD